MVLLFTNGPCGSNSEYGREFFLMKQKAALEKMHASQENGSDGMDALAEVVSAAEVAVVGGKKHSAEESLDEQALLLSASPRYATYLSINGEV